MGIMRIDRIAAPASSTEKVLTITHCTSCTTPPMTSWFMESCMIIRSRRVIWRPMSRNSSVAKVMNPSPPVWISINSTTWPKVE